MPGDFGHGEEPIEQDRPPTLPVVLIVWATLGVALNVGLARFTYGVMLPSLRRDLDLDYLMSGSLSAVHLAGCLAGTLAAPSLGRRIGMSKLSAWAHLLVAAGAALSAVTPQTATGPLVLGIGRLATGIGAGAGIVAILVLAFGSVSARERPFASAIIWSGMGAAVVVSALAVPLLLDTVIGWRAAFAVSAILALAIAVFFPPGGSHIAARNIEPSAATARFSMAELVTGRWFFLVGSYLLFGVGYIAYSTFAGAKLAANHAPTIVIELTWTAFGIAAIAGAALTVPVLRAGRIKRFALIGAIASGGLGAAVAGLDSAGAAFGGAMLVGMGVAATPAIVSAYARNRYSGEEYAKAFSCASAMLGIGQLVGPVAAGALADLFGMAAVPAFVAVAYSLGVLFAACDAIAARRFEHERHVEICKV